MRRGFTLLELIMVMAIMVIIAAMAMPTMLEALYGDTKVSAAADMVRARWAECRAQAIEEGRPYRFAVIPNSGKFKIEPLQNASQSGNVNPDAGGEGAQGQGIIIVDSLPAGVRFSTADANANSDTDESDGTDYQTVAVFLADGSAQEDVMVTFNSKGSGVITLHLRSLTGAVTMDRSSQDEP